MGNFQSATENENNKFSFTWVIANFSMCHHIKGQFLSSPLFVLTFLPGVNWHFRLYPQGDTDEEYSAISLVRDDDASDKCSVHFSFHGLNRKLIFNLTKETGISADEQTCGYTQRADRNYLLSFLIDDTLTLKCTLKPGCDAHACEIDFPHRYKNAPLTDVVLCAGDTSFKVHKAILWARWPKLVDILDKKQTCELVLDMKSDILEAIIKYVYTGAVNFSDSEFLGKLYASTVRYDLPTLNCLPVVSQKVRTRISAEKITFEWPIENSIRLMADPVVDNHNFTVHTLPSCSWNLTLRMYQDVVDTSQNVFETCICKTYDDKPRPIFVKSKISLPDSEPVTNQHLFLRNETWTCTCSFQTISANPERAKFKCEFTFGDCSYSSDIMASSCAFTSSNSYHYFRTDFRNLCLSRKYSDVKIIAGSATFPTHKFILCSRSSVFSAMFDVEMRESKTSVIEISDVEPDIIAEMLLFMYSGSLDKPLEETVVKLYSAADKYDISALKRKCSSFLKANLNAQNVCGILRLADMHSDDDLYECASVFLTADADGAFTNDE